MTPVEALERIAYLLERGREETYRLRAYRGAAEAIRGFSKENLRQLAEQGKLRSLPGVGEKTEQVIREALAGEIPLPRPLRLVGRGLAHPGHGHRRPGSRP